jgi:hypothetical protein
MQQFVAAGLRAVENLHHERVQASASSMATPKSGDRRPKGNCRDPTLPEKLRRSAMPFSGRLGFGPSLWNANTGERYPGGRIACRKRFDQALQDEFVVDRGRFNFTGGLAFGPALATLMARSPLRHHKSA